MTVTPTMSLGGILEKSGGSACGDWVQREGHPWRQRPTASSTASVERRAQQQPQCGSLEARM